MAAPSFVRPVAVRLPLSRNRHNPEARCKQNQRLWFGSFALPAVREWEGPLFLDSIEIEGGIEIHYANQIGKPKTGEVKVMHAPIGTVISGFSPQS